MARARWQLGSHRYAVKEVEVPPGPLGILLDGDDLDRPMLEGFAQVSPSDPLQRGTIELSGRVTVGSLLVGVNEHDFIASDLSFEDVRDVLRVTSDQPRSLKFYVPVAGESERNLPLSQQLAPRRGPPPREEEEDEEEGDADNVASESGSSSAGDSFQEIHVTEAVAPEQVILASAVHAVEDEESDGSMSWTLTGSNVGVSSSTPLTSSVSSASPEKVTQAETQQFSAETVQQMLPEEPQLPFVKDQTMRLSLEIGAASPSLPKELSFGTMAILAETRHFDSDDSSDDSDDSAENFDQPSSRGVSWKPAEAKTRTVRSFPSDRTELLSPQKPRQSSPVPLLMASNVSSGTIAVSLMVQTNQFDRDDSVEEDDAEYVTAVAPPGPLGLNLDGGVLDHAVVMGFVKLRDGSTGALERIGDIMPGSVIVRINEEDVSHASLQEIGIKLSEQSHQPRTIVFRLPPKAQQEEQRLQSTVIRRSPTLSPFVEDFDKRRKLELALIMHYDRQVLPRRDSWFCIDAKWMARWVEFVCRGGPEPGPITNEALLHENWRKMLAHDSPGRPDTAREGLILMKHYRVVVPMVWCLFAELHGLGEAPQLARYLMDIYAEALTDGDVNKVLEVPRPKAAVLANDLRDKCLVRPSRKR